MESKTVPMLETWDPTTARINAEHADSGCCPSIFPPSIFPPDAVFNGRHSWFTDPPSCYRK